MSKMNSAWYWSFTICLALLVLCLLSSSAGGHKSTTLRKVEQMLRYSYRKYNMAKQELNSLAAFEHVTEALDHLRMARWFVGDDDLRKWTGLQASNLEEEAMNLQSILYHNLNKK